MCAFTPQAAPLPPLTTQFWSVTRQTCSPGKTCPQWPAVVLRSVRSTNSQTAPQRHVAELGGNCHCCHGNLRPPLSTHAMAAAQGHPMWASQCQQQGPPLAHISHSGQLWLRLLRFTCVFRPLSWGLMGVELEKKGTMLVGKGRNFHASTAPIHRLHEILRASWGEGKAQGTFKVAVSLKMEGMNC